MRLHRLPCAGALGLALVLWCSAAAANPAAALILLRLLRDHIISASLESGADALSARASREPEPTFGYPPVSPARDAGMDEDAQMRRLIDESFLHLAPAQRAELYTSLMKTLDDPANRELRPQLAAEFRAKALAVRAAYVQLDRLSSSEKKDLAAQARDAYAELPEDERQELLAVLRAGALPVPPDLNRYMLAAFEALPSTPLPVISSVRRGQLEAGDAGHDQRDASQP